MIPTDGSVTATPCHHFSVEKIQGHPPVEEHFGFTMHPTAIHVRMTARR